VPDSAGVPKGYAENTLLADYNNEKSVEDLFKSNDDIACVVVEPVAANMGVVPPKADFLKFLRDITIKHKALLIFDEVITGFRIAYGGASEYFGVKPDMVTLGKIVGGGMPLAAYGGKADIMNVVAPIGNVYQAGTLSGNPIAVTAGIETLKTLRDNPNIYEKINQSAIKLETAYKEKGLIVNRVGSLLSAFFTDESVTDYNTALKSNTKAFASYFSQMLDQGIYVAPSQFEAMFVSFAHSDEDIEKTISAIQNVKL
jgi:glutamate-1-semialdehyde 2,1-aminomutase